MDHPKDCFVDVKGLRARYWKAGEAGPAILLLAGIGCSVEEWQHNIDALAQSHRVYALDMLGGGLTDKPDGDCYSIADLSRFTLDFLSAVGEPCAHMIGNSLGGRIALECARLAPDRVASMVLVAPAGVGRETLINMRLATVPLLGEVLTRPSRAGLRMLWRSAVHDPSLVTDALIEAKYRDACRPGAHQAFLKTLRGFLGLGGFPKAQITVLQASMPAMKQPTLVVWGRNDNLLPAQQANILKANLPNARVVLFDACGHVPQVERPVDFNKTVLDFLATVV
jgi:pimeloyl-ACP methyl ester carboxylesterase